MTDLPPPRVSVLIPVYNGEEFIAKSITSALDQTLRQIEVIVIDDASTDRSTETVRALADRDPRLRLVEAAENGGPGAARTLGLRAARGDWIAILDADDEMVPTRIETLVKIAERDKLDAIADNLSLRDPGSGEIVASAFPLSQSDSMDLTAETYLDNIRPGGRVNLGWMQPLTRREFLLNHGIEWPGVRHAEDMVFVMRLLMSGARYRLIGEEGYIYTQRWGTHSGRISNATRTQRSISQQHLALDLVLTDPAVVSLSPRARRRLNLMRHEITATSHVLNARDNVQSGKPWAAAGSIARLGMVPLGFARSVKGRFWNRDGIK